VTDFYYIIRKNQSIFFCKLGVIIMSYSIVADHLLTFYAMRNTVLNSSEENLTAVDMDDLRIINEVLNDNYNTFENLIKKYQGIISSQMYRFSRNTADVEELTHDVFVKAYLSLNSFKGKSPFIHWLRKIAVRVGYKFWKEKARRKELYISFSDIEGSVEALINNRITDVNRAGELLDGLLQFLKPRDRLILTLIYWDGYTIAETAKLTGWSKTIIKVQAHRARKKLKKHLEEFMK
jgi:RNA polymerase sigma-70 factor (ECF subfamily)